MPQIPTQVVQLTANTHLSIFQNRASFLTLRKSLYDTYGEVTELGVSNPASGLPPAKYLVYKSGGTVYVVDEFGNPTSFSALEASSGDRPGSMLKAYNKMIDRGRNH